MIWTAAHRQWQFPGPTLLMGVVNVTPDSFFDGGRHFAPEEAVRHGLALAAEGADILDVGGESTRPGAEPVDEAEELRRVLASVLADRYAGLAATGWEPSEAEVRRDVHELLGGGFERFCQR